ETNQVARFIIHYQEAVRARVEYGIADVRANSAHQGADRWIQAVRIDDRDISIIERVGNNRVPFRVAGFVGPGGAVPPHNQTYIRRGGQPRSHCWGRWRWSTVGRDLGG